MYRSSTPIILCCLFFFTAAVEIHPAYAQERPATGIEKVLAKNDAALARIKSISFEFTKEIKITPVHKEPFEDVITGKIQESGGYKNWVADSKHHVENEKGERLADERLVQHLVVNDSFVATWTKGKAGMIQLFDHESLAKISTDGAAHMSIVDGNLMWFAGGYQRGRLSKLYDDGKRYGRWELQEADPIDGQPVIRLAKYWWQGGDGVNPWLQQYWDISEQTGLVVSHKGYAEPNVLLAEYAVKYEEINGVSVPQHITHTRYALILVGQLGTEVHQATPTYTEKIDLKKTQVNIDIDPKTFTLAGLSAPDGQMIAHTKVDETKSLEYLKGDVGVPGPSIKGKSNR